MDKIAEYSSSTLDHMAGTFENQVLARIESLLPEKMERTAETGCGKSTILFSNLSEHHTVFCIDDRSDGERSSVRYFESSALTRRQAIRCVFGPTQLTLPRYTHTGPYDCVLLDGPHGYPFPELEYYFFYPHLRQGGFLLVDDVQIPSIGRFADFLQEDEMFEPVELVGTTAVFRRTSAETFSPIGDGWWTQRFNRRRIPASSEFYCGDGQLLTAFHERIGGGPGATRASSSAPSTGRSIVGLGSRVRRAARMLLDGS